MRHHGGSSSGGIPLNRNHVFDSNGPDVRIRGTAQQFSEKYLQLGRDATSSGDRVMAEAYFQHAEHYFRILNAMTQAAQQNSSRTARAAAASRGGNRRRAVRRARNRPGQRPVPRKASRVRPGMGDQPESREIPIAAAPPEG